MANRVGLKNKGIYKLHTLNAKNCVVRLVLLTLSLFDFRSDLMQGF